MIRALATLIGIAAALAGSVGAFAAMRAVGPEDRTNEVGFGDAATVPPGGGTLFESRNFRRVVVALRRELGHDGRIDSLDLQATGATATARRGGRVVFVQIDASGRSSAREADRDDAPRALVPVARIEPPAIDRIRRGVGRETDAQIDRIALIGSSREWNVRMTEGEPDTFTANLDGRGLRLPGEPNPAPVGAQPDSLLRAQTLARVLDAVRGEAGEEARVTALDIRPDRVGIEVADGRRTLSLAYGYEAQLTGRDIQPRTGADDDRQVRLGALDPAAVERMARAARRELDTRGLADVQYVVLGFGGIAGAGPQLALYLPSGSDPGYVGASLDGRGLTWVGKN